MDEKLRLVCFWEAIEAYFRSYLKLPSTFCLSRLHLSCSARASVHSGGVECQAVGLGDGRYRTISEMNRCERDQKAKADEDWISERRVRHHYYDMGVLVLLGRQSGRNSRDGASPLRGVQCSPGKQRRWRVGVVWHYHPSTQETEGPGRIR
ncbi:hypothetical protein EDB89DRAFT_1911499 [Lactarius sanguifluus]|nr:hypothetical protein EDB89DRAFT_1911499 [Lactarius sanguifluus]